MFIDNDIDIRDLEFIERHIDLLPIGGFKHQAESLLNNKDLSGGLVSMQDQADMLKQQIINYLNNKIAV